MLDNVRNEVHGQTADAAKGREWLAALRADVPLVQIAVAYDRPIAIVFAAIFAELAEPRPKARPVTSFDRKCLDALREGQTPGQIALRFRKPRKQVFDGIFRAAQQAASEVAAKEAAEETISPPPFTAPTFAPPYHGNGDRKPHVAMTPFPKVEEFGPVRTPAQRRVDRASLDAREGEAQRREGAIPPFDPRSPIAHLTRR